jgi:type III secretion protein J
MNSGPLAPALRRGMAILLALFCLLFLSACKMELYQNLSESTANELLSALLERGIPAEKVSKGKNGFSVAVPEEDQLRSLAVLRDLGLPKPDYASLGTVFRKEGMMSSPMEERARFAYALSQELAASCARLDGVVDARVHIVLNERDIATGTVTPASAAVLLRYAPDTPVDGYIPQIQQLVAQAVPDVSLERVRVLTFPVLGDTTRPEAPRGKANSSWAETLWDQNGIWLLPIVFMLGLALGAGVLLAYRRPG